MHLKKVCVSRRTFMGGAAALGAAGLVPGKAFGADAKPDSLFGGVQIGTITYSYRSWRHDAVSLLPLVVASGISSIELMGDTAEGFKAPADAASGTPDDDMAKYVALRKMYQDAGVKIHIVKFGNIGDKNMTDEKIDYYFRAAKALGAKGITREISDVAAKRLGPIADKHQIMIGFHNHTQINAKTYDGPILSYGKFLAINLDIGHYVAANDDSVLEIIEKYRDRILSLHLKDRKSRANKGANMPFGQGDTPIVAALKYMQTNKLSFPADIELEYAIPKGSDSVKEVAKCVQFCKQALA